MKNYYIYEHNGKIKRESIRLDDIYPESYAMKRIPDNAEIFAKIAKSKRASEKHIKTCWQKHALRFYPCITMNKEQEKDHLRAWDKKQSEYKEHYRNLITSEESRLLG